MQYPTLLKCVYFKNDIPDVQPKRIVKDYEFDFYLEGGRNITINKTEYAPTPFSLVIRKPGDVVSGSGTFNCYMLTLDFSNTKAQSSYNRNQPGTIQPITESYLLPELPTVFVPVHKEQCLKLMQLLSIYSTNRHSDIIHSIIMEFLCLVAADAYGLLHEEHSVPYDFAYVCSYMQNHYSTNLTSRQLASLIHLNESYFIREFKKQIGTTPMRYLLEIRMDNAKLLLLNTELPINEIAIRCGFCDASYFTYLFKKSFQMTPRGYRTK